MSLPAPAPTETDDHQALVDDVLLAAGGDVRKAILGLVLGQRQLEQEAARAISTGYVRRGVRSGMG